MISNIKVEDYHVRKEVSKDNNISKILSKIKKDTGEDISLLLPEKIKKVSFDMSCEPQMANAIRRIMDSELEVYSLDLIFESLKTSDKYLLYDKFTKNVQAIKLNQDKAKKLFDKQQTFEISVKNDSDNYRYIISNDIGPEKLFADNILLHKLHPKKFIKCKLRIIRGKATKSANAFAILPCVEYHIHEDPAKSSMEKSPNKFTLKYKLYGTYEDELRPLKEAIEILIKKLEFFSKLISNKLIKGIFRNKDVLIKKEGTFHYITLYNETITLTQLLSKYTYLNNPQIEFITDKLEHPMQRVVIMKIKDKNALNMLQDTCDNLIKKLKKTKI